MVSWKILRKISEEQTDLACLRLKQSMAKGMKLLWLTWERSTSNGHWKINHNVPYTIILKRPRCHYHSRARMCVPRHCGKCTFSLPRAAQQEGASHGSFNNFQFLPTNSALISHSHIKWEAEKISQFNELDSKFQEILCKLERSVIWVRL